MDLVVAEILAGLVVVAIAAGLLADEPCIDVHGETYEDETPNKGT